MYILDPAGENLFQDGHHEAGLHTWGHNLDERVYFNDFGIRLGSTGSGDKVLRPVWKKSGACSVCRAN